VQYPFFDSKAVVSYRLSAFFNYTDVRQKIEISWKPTARVQLSIGKIFYGGGSDQEIFGQYDHRDFVYGTIKLIF
jgi:hypothetical protein